MSQTSSIIQSLQPKSDDDHQFVNSYMDHLFETKGGFGDRTFRKIQFYDRAIIPPEALSFGVDEDDNNIGVQSKMQRVAFSALSGLNHAKKYFGEAIGIEYGPVDYHYTSSRSKSVLNGNRASIKVTLKFSQGGHKHKQELVFYFDRQLGKFGVSTKGYGQNENITKACLDVLCYHAKKANAMPGKNINRKIVIDLNLPSRGHPLRDTVIKSIQAYIAQQKLTEKDAFLEVLRKEDKAALDLVPRQEELDAEVFAGSNPPPSSDVGAGSPAGGVSRNALIGTGESKSDPDSDLDLVSPIER